MHSNLKKLGIICFILLSFSLKVTAPIFKSLMICELPPIEPYKKLVFAIGMVETGCDTLAYNPLEAAAGYFQIRPVRLVEYNRRTGNSYARKDLFNYETSEKIFLYFAGNIGPYKLEQIARNWNGSGKLTDSYWARIKHYLL